MLPQMQQLTSLAADEGAMIVRQLQQGVITVEQARARIISLNATIEIMMAETAAQVAAGMGRSINLTTVPFTSQPVVDPVTGKSNMKEMFHKPETAALVDDVARGLGVRTSGGGYSIETTKPRIILPKRGPSRGFNDGGYVYTLEDGPVVPGDKSVNYDNTMAKIPVGGFVLNQDATRNNPQLVEYAKKSKPYNRGGMIDAMLTPYETVFTPEQTQEMLPILEAANNGQRIQFRNAGGILGGPIVSGKHNYGRFKLPKSVIDAGEDLLSPIMKMGKKVATSGSNAQKFVDETLGAAAPVKRTLKNPFGYFFVGNWGLNTRKTTNSKINSSTAKPQEIIDDIMSLPPSEALPALKRFLKVNKIDDDMADSLVLEARDKIVGNFQAHGDTLIGEKLFAKAQHDVYLEIAERLGLRKKYIRSLGIPGQRRAFRKPGDTKSGFKAATGINPYGTTSVDELIAKNDEFGTDFMGSYESYNPKGMTVNGERGAFAHMQLDEFEEFAMGGPILKKKRNYGRLFLGMPKSIKQVQEQRKRREVMEQTTEAVNKSRFAKEEPTNFGKKEEDTKGHSFPVEGVGGVYTKPDGTRVFVKPVLDETAALAEQRYNAIHQGAHRLTTPQQEIRVMIDPTDPAGKRKLLVLESPYDPRFASLPKEMSEQEYFQQLLASALRGDKDLSPGNIGGSFVADGGTMGVFKTASGLRSYADDMPSVGEQARINLLGVKGGAKRFFAESTVDIPRGMTPQQYQQSMLNEIDEVLPRLKETIAGFKGLTPREEEVYAAMIKRLEDARHVNWKELHGIHAAVKPSAPKSLTPAALAKLEEAAALRARQKGHAVSLSDMAFKSDANGFNGGGLINVIKSLAMRRIGAGFGKNTTGGWGVTSLEIGMAEKLFASSGLTKRTQRILYDKFAEALAKEMPYGYSKNAQGQLLKALEPDIMDSVIRSAASSTISAPEGRKVLSAIDRDILKRRYTNWESRKDTPLTEELKKLIFGLEGREKGGPVSGGTPYIVGEKGPEIFVPMNSGGIVPNHALGGMIKSGKYNYGALGPVAGIVAQQALPMAAFMLLPKALEKLGIASEKSNLILNAMFGVMMAGGIYKQVKGLKASKAATAAGAADDVTAVAAAERNVGRFGQSLAKLNAAGKAIPGWGKVAIFALTTLATVSYGAWENARKARLASQEALDVNEIQAKQLGITYTSLTDKIKKATEAAKAQGELAKIKAAGSTAIGGGINMSVKELNALQKKAKETQGDIVQMFNNLDENDVTKAATALKVQLVAAGKSAQEAAKEIYSIISVSNKAAQATAAVSSSEFLRVVDRASAARVAIETFVKSIEGADVDKKEIAASFSGGLDAIQLYYQSLVGIKDETGKAKTQTEALNDTIEQMNANKNNQKDIGDDILNLLVKENPLYKDILNSNDSMVDAWAKIQLYTNGVTANLSGLSGQEAQDLLQVVTAISQAASEMTTNANLLNNPLDAIADYGFRAKEAYDKAKKASDDATKNAQKNADAEIKALDKKIEKINEEADARIRAIEDQAEKQDYLTEVQKEQLNYQQALLAGDMSRAAQSQLNIQSLTNERQKTLSIDAIQDKRDADVKKLEEAKAAVQERLIKLQEKANKLQEIANIKQKEYASIQALQQSIATTISKAGMTTDEGVLGTLAKALQSVVAALAAINSEGAAAAKTVTADVPMTASRTVTYAKGASFQQPGTADWLTYLKKITNDPGGASNSAVEYAEKYFDGFGEHVDSFGMYVKKLLGLPEVGEANAFANAKGAPIKLTFDKKTGQYIDSSGKVYKESERFFMPKPAEDTPGGAQYKSFRHPIAANRGTTIREDDGRAKFKDYTDPKTGYTYTADGRVTDKNGKIIGRWASENYASNPWDKKIVSYNKGGKVKYFEPGGKVSGPGTGTSDSIPAMLSNGEYVIKADSVSKYGVDTFDALNAQKLAGGGAVGLGSPAPINSGYLNKGGMIPGYFLGGLAGWGFKKIPQIAGSAGIWQTMEELEKYLSLKYGADEKDSGLEKWSKALGRVAFNTAQGGLSGLTFGGVGGLFGVGEGLIEGLIGLAKDGSAYGVKGGSSLEKYKSNNHKAKAKQALDAMSFGNSAKQVAMTAGLSIPFGLGTNKIISKFGPAISKKLKGTLNKLKSGTANTLTSAMLGFGAPFADKKVLPASSKPQIKITSPIKAPVKKDDFPPFVEHEGQNIPIHKDLFPLAKPAIFQGHLEDLSSLSGYVDIIDTKPDSILSYILKHQPNNKRAKRLLDKINAQKWDDSEVKDFLMDMMATSNLKPHTKTNEMMTASNSGARELARLIRAMGGSVEDAIQVKARRKEITPLLGHMVDDYVEHIENVRAVRAEYDARHGGAPGGLNGMRGEPVMTRSERAKMAALGWGNAYRPPSPDETAMVRVFNDDFPVLNSKGQLSEEPAAHFIWNRWFGTDSPILDEGETLEDLYNARMSRHFTVGDAVQSHFQGEWKPNKPFIVSTLSNLMHYNKKPEQLHSRDSYWLTEFGKRFIYSKKEGKLSSGFPLEEEDYIKKLIELGLYKKGQPLPLLAEDAVGKNVYFLDKTQYSIMELQDIAKQFSENPNLRPMEYAPSEGSGGFDLVMPSRNSYDGAYKVDAQRALQIMAIEKAKQQIGIDQPYQFHTSGGDHASIHAYELEEIANRLGVRFDGGHSSGDIDNLATTLGGYNMFTNLLSPAKLEQDRPNEGVTTATKALSTFLMNMRFGKLNSGKVIPNPQDKAEMLEYELKFGIRNQIDRILAERATTRTTPVATVPKGRTSAATGGYVIEGNISIPKFENGINMVPADMLAMLHKNEAVVPANMNPFNPNANNATMGGGVYNITNNINGFDGDINALSDMVTRKTVDSIKTMSKISVKSMGESRSLGSGLEVRA